MIELIIVIVIAGILAAVMIPRLERDNLREAANQLVRHIQYTQHLAMVDDVYDASKTSWYQDRWTIDLCGTAYVIKRANNSDTAVDVMTKRDINGTDNDLADMGVNSIALDGTTNNCKVVFDNLGRPYRMSGAPASPLGGLMTTDTVITLSTSAGRSATINITKETGFVKITNIN